MARANQFRPNVDLDPEASRQGRDDDFNPDELRPIPYRPDTEVMLGPMRLGILFFVLVLLCGLCFLLGYGLGKRGVHVSPSTSQQPGAKTSSLPAGSVPKPSAVPQAPSRSQHAGDGQSPSDEANTASVPDSPASGLPAATAPALMVQIAAVSHKDDADVLVAALRKRGYAVNVRRDPADGLIHVRVGPFNSLADANATRQKLLNDGYNASVQP